MTPKVWHQVIIAQAIIQTDIGDAWILQWVKASTQIFHQFEVTPLDSGIIGLLIEKTVISHVTVDLAHCS